MVEYGDRFRRPQANRIQRRISLQTAQELVGSLILHTNDIDVTEHTSFPIESYLSYHKNKKITRYRLFLSLDSTSDEEKSTRELLATFGPKQYKKLIDSNKIIRK